MPASDEQKLPDRLAAVLPRHAYRYGMTGLKRERVFTTHLGDNARREMSEDTLGYVHWSFSINNGMFSQDITFVERT